MLKKTSTRTKKIASRSKQTASLRGPTLEQQLKGSGVTPGSALEALIKQNQDFSILDPSELNDGGPFPLWLRVYVRKSHPELTFSGTPVRYPLILKEILSYMIRHQDLPQVGAQASVSTR
jgi:hypothetical protein